MLGCVLGVCWLRIVEVCSSKLGCMLLRFLGVCWGKYRYVAGKSFGNVLGVGTLVLHS
jgi:hypothetical protein